MLALIAPLVVPNTTKIVLLSLDGLGGLPRPETGRSEPEPARLPTPAALAAEAACGRLRHVAPGITPGSGPGHLGLFGYDPLLYRVGRGVLEALGIEFALRAGDVAARGNFCTVDAAGRITDRRAGRIPTDTCVELTERLRTIRLPGVELFVEPVKEHRFVLVLRQTRRRGALPARRSAAAPPPAGAARRPAREQGPAPRVRPAPEAPALPGGLRPRERGDRGVPDVPRAREARRHGGAQDGGHVRRRGRHAPRALGRLRLLLRPLQGHRQGGRGRGVRREGGRPRAPR